MLLGTHVKPRVVLRWLCVIVVIVFGVQTVRLAHSRWKAQGTRTGSPIPYTVILKETVFKPDGSVITGLHSTQTQAVRSDGSFLIQSAFELGDEIKKQRMIQFAFGIVVNTNDLTNTKSTASLGKANPARAQRDPNTNCISSFAGEPFAEKEIISGEETISTYRTVKITRYGGTLWLAPDYGCAIVKTRYDWGSEGVTEQNVVSLVLGEPDGHLFNVPADFREVPPSELFLGPDKLETLRPAEVENLRKADQNYYENRPNQ